MRAGGLNEFVSFLGAQREKESRWEYFIHKYHGTSSFDDWEKEVNGYG